eukprot:TRINITY_DN10135_c0_g1_i1.p1 TRINITY_DN10135_c0_g1~~TRINITY_DN10135_c0_g1_i1.p1  ORF type:complete len:160 (+),score=17.96 TRINITY_DN10135_c0_g1_i1:32-511(+)
MAEETPTTNANLICGGVITLAIYIPALAIGASSLSNTCSAGATIELPIWLTVAGAVNLSIYFLNLCLFNIVTGGGSDDEDKQSNWRTISRPFSGMVGLFNLTWFILGAMSYWGGSANACYGLSLGQMTLALLILTIIGLSLVCCACICLIVAGGAAAAG